MNMKNKRVVVFGATGTLGAPVALHLKNAGYDVTAVGHRPDDNGFFAGYGIDYFSADVSRAEDFDALPSEEVFAVLDFAGALPASMEGYNAGVYVSSIVQGTLNVLDYAVKVKADRFVFPQSLFDVSYMFGSRTPIPADSPRKAPMDGDHAALAQELNDSGHVCDRKERGCGSD